MKKLSFYLIAKRMICALLALFTVVSLVSCGLDNKGPIDVSSGTEGDDSSDETVVERSELPEIFYLYNTGYLHEDVAAYFEDVFDDLGCDTFLDVRDFEKFLSCRSEGNFTLARGGWIADYNDPITFLELWTSDSDANDAQLGQGAHAKLKMYALDLTEFGYDVKIQNGTWAQTYDVLISKIKACTNKQDRYAMMHLAEDMLMDTGCILPIYYYTDAYMMKNVTKGFYANPLGYKFFSKCVTATNPNSRLNVWMAEDPGSIDPSTVFSDNSGTILSHLFAGLAKWSRDGKGNSVIVADCAKELPRGVVNKNGTVTYTYTLKDGLKWSDGTDLTAQDFVAAWNRAYANETDYSYLFEVIDGYYEGELKISAPTRNTIRITLYEDVPYFNELLAHPLFFPVPSEAITYEYWGMNEMAFKCNGAYKLYSWYNDSYLMLDANPLYHDAANVKITELNFLFGAYIGDPLLNFNQGSCHVLYDLPSPNISDLEQRYPDEFKIDGIMGTYFAFWNVNADLLPSTNLKGTKKEAAQAEIRKAMSLLIDRNHVVDEVCTEPAFPAFSLVPVGVSDYGGAEFCKNANGGVDENGYYGYYNTIESAHDANVSGAMEVLKKYYKID